MEAKVPASEGVTSRTRAAQLKSTSLKECLKGEPLKAGQRSSGVHVSRASFSATGCSPRLTCPHVLPRCTAKLYPDCSRLAVAFGPQSPNITPSGFSGPCHDDNGAKHRRRAKPQVMALASMTSAEDALREIVTDEYVTSRKPAASRARIWNRLPPRSRRSSTRAPIRGAARRREELWQAPQGERTRAHSLQILALATTQPVSKTRLKEPLKGGLGGETFRGEPKTKYGGRSWLASIILAFA